LTAETPAGTRATGELFEPPAGYHLAAGFLVTYDLAVTSLVDTVLARLAGAQAHERYEIGLADPTLTIAYERLHAGAMVPAWNVELVRCPTSEGRPLHAKGGLLRFQPEDGRRRPLLRGWVGSANLTAGGLQRNHELVLAGECALGQTDPAVTQAAHLCDAVADAAGDLARKRLGGVLTRRERRRGTRQLLHTIGEHRTLLEAAPIPDGFRRLDIITPVYQARGSGGAVAEALRPILPPPGGEVRIYTSTDHEVIEEGRHHVTAFPTSLTDALRDTHGLTAALYFLPEVMDGQRRRLHTKAYILHGATEAVVLVGSANATHSGLTGANREALAIHRLEPGEASQWLDTHLTDHCWTDLHPDEERLPDVDHDVARGDDLAAESYAELSIADGTDVGPDGRWVGRLVVYGLRPGQRLTVHLGGRSAAATVGADGQVDVSALFDDAPTALLPHEGAVRIEDEIGGFHDVVIYAHASAEWFAEAIAVRDRPPRPRSTQEVHDLERLLASLRRFHEPNRAGNAPPGGGHADEDDRLSLPLDRRFDLVAKFAAQFPLATDEEIRHYLEAGDGDPRYEVVRAIRAARSGGTAEGLLGHLQVAVRDIAKERA
jgi:hypothetical protein